MPCSRRQTVDSVMTSLDDVTWRLEVRAAMTLTLTWLAVHVIKNAEPLSTLPTHAGRAGPGRAVYWRVLWRACWQHTPSTPSARLWVTQIQRLVASPLTGLGINWFIIVSHRSAQRALTDWPTLCLQCQLRRTWLTSERSFSAAAVKIHTNDFKSSFSVALLTTVSLSNLGVLASEGWWEPWRPQSESRSLQWSEIDPIHHLSNDTTLNDLEWPLTPLQGHYIFERRIS